MGQDYIGIVVTYRAICKLVLIKVEISENCFVVVARFMGENYSFVSYDC